MKKLIIIFFLLFSFSFYSCQKDNLHKVQSESFDKEQVYDIFTSKSDQYIRNLEIDLDSIINEIFTPFEREELIILRTKNVLKNGAEQKMKEFFDSFRSEYSKSYLNGSFVEREKFAGKFLKVLKKERINIDKVSNCTWPWLNCTDLNICSTEGDFVFYKQRRSAQKETVFHDCVKQEGTSDCDNSYYWIPTSHEYNHKDQYNFIWYCANSVYRSYMPSDISGFRSPDFLNYATFLGN